MLAVRTSNRKIDEVTTDGYNRGSGILFATRSRTYVLTAQHCIKDMSKEEILVQLLSDTGVPRRLTVKDVIPGTEEDDYALLVVEDPRNGYPYRSIKFGSKDLVLSEEPKPNYGFRGFPRKARTGQTFDVAFSSRNEWFVDGEFDYSNFTFAEQMEGASGAGVIAEVGRSLKCVGIIKEFKNQTGIFQTMIANPISFYAKALSAYGEKGFEKDSMPETEGKILDDAEGYKVRYCATSQTESIPFLLEGDKNTLVDYVKGLISDYNGYFFLLLGDAQSGKTYELKHLAHFLSSEGYTILQYNNRNFDKLSSIPEPDDDSPIAVLIDAIDEAPEANFQQIISTVESYSSNHDETIVVVSSREGYVQESQLNGFCRLYLQDLTDAQVAEIITDSVGNPSQLFSQIKDSGISDLVCKPFFLKHVIECFNKGEYLPSNNALLYRSWIASCCNDLVAKKPELADNFDKAYDPLLKMALALQFTANVQIPSADLVNIVGENGLEILKHNKVISHEAEIFTFVHNCVREYLVANKLLSLPEDDVLTKVCYSGTKTLNPIWTNVVVLWLQLSCSDKGKLSASLIDWLGTNQSARSLLLSCEVKCIGEDVRFSIFKGIIEDISRRGRYLSWFDHSFISRLVHFADSPSLYNYLYSELSGCKEPSPQYYNLMLLTTIVDWNRVESQDKGLFESLKSLMVVNLSQFKQYRPENGYMYFLLNEKFYNDNDIVDTAIGLFKDDERADTLSSILSLIVRSVTADKYLGYIIGKGKILASRDGNVYTIRSIQYKALASVTQTDNILAALRYACSVEVTENIYNQDDYLEMIDSLLGNVRSSKGANNKEELAQSIAECFKLRFADKLVFVDERLRKELDYYKTTLLSCDGWTDDLDALYSELYNRGRITPEREAEIKAQRQKDFDDFCNYQTFRMQVLAVVSRYEESGSQDWVGFGVDVDGRYNLFLNRYLADICGIRAMDYNLVRSIIKNEPLYNCYRLSIVDEHMYGRSDKYEISKEIMASVVFTALALLKDEISGKHPDYQFLRSAIHFLIAGHVQLSDDDLSQLIKYSHECISGSYDIDGYEDSTSLLETMCNQMGDENVAELICSRLVNYTDGSTLYFMQWARFLLSISYPRAKDLLLAIWRKTQNAALKDTLLSLLIEYNTGIDDICTLIPSMSDQDLVHCCNELDGREECKGVIINVLEARLDSLESYHLRVCLSILLKCGSMKAIVYAGSNLELIAKISENIEFCYDTPDSLPYLSILLPVVQQSEYIRRASTSIIESMGKIAERSQEDYEKVCLEIDDCIKHDSSLSFLENTKIHFYNRLLQRMEHKMTFEEAINTINEMVL